MPFLYKYLIGGVNANTERASGYDVQKITGSY